MNICKRCKKSFPKYLIINNKRIRLYNRKHCLECLPLGTNKNKHFASIMQNRICANCGETFFHKRKDKKYCYNCMPKNSNTNKFKILEGKLLICKICNNKYKYKARLSCTRDVCHSCIIKIRRIELKKRAIKFLGGSCIVCGYHKCYDALIFHHLDPKQKDFNISDKLTWKIISKEVKKCALLCANCHYELHAVMRNKDETADIYKKVYKRNKSSGKSKAKIKYRIC